ncbi:hypothetical protein H0W91_04260 [Patescibacteria group bacterium]|nr:hypothetical protein [Patescibacteria group bacterium]
MNKNIKLEQVKKYVDKITDGLSLKIDDGIKETVVFFNALDINTSGSCEGHLSWGLCGPWIDVSPKETKIFLSIIKKRENVWKLLKIEEKRKKPNKKVTDKFDKQYSRFRHILDVYNAKENRKIFILLQKFYKNRNVDMDSRLVLNTTGWGSRLQCQGTEMQVLENEKNKKINLRRYQNEMNLFTEFLKKEYFKN